MQDKIRQPVLSLRCKELFKERSDKIKAQQRLNGLLLRNEGLIRKTPESKSSLVAKLKSTHIKIKSELDSKNNDISSMEENIVRSGCPGLSL